LSEVVDIFGQIFGMFSNFIMNLLNVLGGNLSPVTREALTGFFLLCLALRLLNGGQQKIKLVARRLQRKDEDDDEDEEYEYVRVRRQ
jgi:hypothetical protein